MGKLLKLAGLAGIAGIVYKKVTGSKGAATSAPPAPATAAPAPRDVGGASPDEELADEAAAPHVPSTPDNPITVTEVPD
jgi:hypothetical protein